MKKYFVWVSMLFMMLLVLPAFAKISFIKIKKPGLSEERIAEGIKEALRVGTENSVKQTGCRDGYFGNPMIKILMPEKLQKAEKTLRNAGYGSKVDEFILSMNRAAEQAAPFAKDIFWDAVKQMSFEEVGKIWKGHDTAATEYFRLKTYDQLKFTFKPVVTEAMNKVQVTRKYKELELHAKRIPFVKVEMVDLDEYVVTKALDGLFYMLGEEEKRIRKEPAARVTRILKEVFGSSE